MPVPRPLWLDLDAIARRLDSSRSLHVACDYDGTLTPIVPRPGDARLHPRTRDALARLAAAPGAHVAVLSGRRLDDLGAQLDLPGVFLAGAGGLETLAPDGTRETHVPEDHALPAALRESLDGWCQRHPGTWLEDKGLAVAVHYRELPLRFRAAFCSGVRRRIAPMRGRLRVVPGKRVFELLPGVEWGKSEALDLWRSRTGGDGMLFFFGDDTIDEPVHRRVRARNGISVAVGRKASKAYYGLRAPGEVLWFLEWLDREWRARRAA